MQQIKNILFKMYSILKKKTINYGLEILRMKMSFWIILNHLYKPKNKRIDNIIIRHRFHVPTFFIISFYFLNYRLSIRKINKFQERLERLLIPYILYPILTYFLFNSLFYFFNFNSLRSSFYQLITQFLVGRGICGVLWFHFNLIIITIFFYIICLVFNNNYLFYLQILGIFSYIIQYSELNYTFFIRYNKIITFSVGYFAEAIPLAVTGLSIGSIDIINKLKKNRLITIFFSISFLFLFFKYNIFTSVKGFGKQGIMYNIGGVSFFLIFSLIPFEVCNKKILVLIKYLTGYTPGIYLLHISIYKIFRFKIYLIKHHTFLGCLLIYFTCYSVSCIGYNIFKKNKLKY